MTAEMLASNRGLRAVLIRSSQQLYMAGVFASITAMVGIPLVLADCVVLIERRVLRWKPGGHSSGI
jgi:ABC-type nitrate/sulfonate/bicarbonate transport system permease component